MTQALATCMTGFALAVALSPVQAYDLTEKFSIGGLLAAGYQYQLLDRNAGANDEGGGAVVVQPEFSLRPTERDEFFLKLGFAAGNGINKKSPFALTPWAADLEDDVTDINGRHRDTLLTAWYKHVFTVGPNALELSGGIIDATDYLDKNAYANDVYTQFMNQVLVNGPHGFVPSYDIGGAFGWDRGAFAFRAVVMNVGKNDDGNNFTFFGTQVAYTMTTALGKGTYRLIVDGTTKDFLNPSGTNKKMLGGLLLSFDQQCGRLLGAFTRLGWQRDEAAVNFQALYSGGINISGQLWRRPQDNMGLGYAYLDGSNTGINHTNVFELYVRIMLNDYVAFTGDVQYMGEALDGGGGPQGWIPGFRVTAAF